MANILCIGAGYVADRPAVTAKHCPEHRFVVVDINKERIAEWQSDNLPVYEPGLDEVVRSVRGRTCFSQRKLNATLMSVISYSSA
jgi:UDPglucose 6-dehydrogenase